MAVAFHRNPDLWAQALSVLTVRQKAYMVRYADYGTHADARDAMKPKVTRAEYVGWGAIVAEVIEHGVQLITDNATGFALQFRRSLLARAMVTKAEGLESEDEKVRQGVATEIIEAELGKPGVKEIDDTKDRKLIALMSRMTEATEKSAGIRRQVIIDGNTGEVVDGEADE